MHSSAFPETLRRSSRVRLNSPMLVTSMGSGVHFSEMCETLVVNAHGCAVRSPVKLEAGVPIQLHSHEGREASAIVVNCQPLGSDRQGWRVGARLDNPENFWDLTPCPEDWVPWAVMSTRTEAVPRPGKVHKVDTSLRLVPDKALQQLSEEQVKMLVSEVIQPLQAEIAELKEKLGHGGEPKRSSFEVSLSYIPPELEEKLWTRLRQDLGAQVLQHASEQADQVLGKARAAIQLKLTETQDEFRQRVTEELRTVEHKAQTLSESIDDRVRQHLRVGLEKFQQHVFEAGTQLERRSDDYFQSLQQRLSEDNDLRVREIQEVQAAVEQEARKLRELIDDLGGRVNKLDDSARRLEFDLDARLARMSGEIISRARTQLEAAVDVVLKELGTRNAKELEAQLDGACERLKNVQKQIETSSSSLLRAQVSETLMTFGQTMEALAQDSVGRWRTALSRDLSSVARMLGEEVRSEAEDRS
jgi:hypothetical protein